MSHVKTLLPSGSLKHTHTLSLKRTHTHTHAHSQTHAHSNTHILSHTHTQTRTISNTHALSLKHVHTHSSTHTHSQTRTHTLSNTRLHSPEGSIDDKKVLYNNIQVPVHLIAQSVSQSVAPQASVYAGRGQLVNEITDGTTSTK